MRNLLLCIISLFALFLTVGFFFRPSAQTNSFSFGMGGDFGVGSEANATLDKIAQSNLSFFLAVGDLSYGDATESDWCTYVKQRLGSTFSFEIVSGNHEDGDVPREGFIDNFAACLPHRLGTLTATYGREYYFDYQGLARFIMISPSIDYVSGTWDYSKGTSRYNFVSQAIDSARQAGISWVFVGMHKNCITTGNKSCEITEDLMNLLISKRVDVVFQGHDHNYQRSKQLAIGSGCQSVLAGQFNPSCVVNNSSTSSYQKGAGTIFVISGNAGKCCYNVVSSDTEAGYFATIVGNKSTRTNGFTKFTLSATRLDEQVISSVGTYSDSFSIVNEEGLSGTPPPTSTSTTCQNNPPLDAASVTLSLTLSSGGNFKIWTRLMSGVTSADSYYLQVDGGCPINVGDGATMPTNSWEWIDTIDGMSTPLTMNLAAGSHVVKLIEREQNVGIDRLLFTLDQACVPTGTGGNCLAVTPSISPLISPTLIPPSVNPTPSSTPLPTQNPSLTPTPSRIPTDTPIPTLRPSPSLTLTPAPTFSLPEKVVIIPEDDTYVSSDAKSRNFGKSEKIAVDGSPVQIAYLKFNLNNPGLVGRTIISARLKLKVTNESEGIQQVKAVTDTSWKENEITYLNRPEVSSAKLGEFNGGDRGDSIEVVLTNYVSSHVGRFISIAIDSSSKNGLDFKSKEARSDRPKLIIYVQ
ncbi:DNRLRE domain-containing protein [Candidatus Gottesmanbacteria bacterium]|nr:DNRLRE domain-containing protein [Candidatus Gottesmanbacteria bacterium]